MILTVILAVALGLRVLLDLTSLFRTDWRLDAAYAALFAMVASGMLMQDRSNIFGYAAGLIACVSAGKAVMTARR